MKKTVALCLILGTLLCGCQKETDGTAADTKDPPVKNEQNQTIGSTDTSQSGSQEDQTRLAYYEQLVNELQQEVLNLKTEIYTNRVEYEAHIEELKASQAPSGSTSPSALFQYTVTNGQATLTAYIGKDKAVDIPTTVDGYPVVAIGDRTFLDNAALTSVTIPQGVTSIGWFAFSGCVSLEYVSIPDSVETISYGAFQNCDTQMTVSCPIGSYADRYAQSYGLKIAH